MTDRRRSIRDKLPLDLPPSCEPYHRPEPRLPYLAAHADAVRRMERGEVQRRCPACGLLAWESSFKAAMCGDKRGF